MGLLNLVGRISLDGAPFKQTLQNLKLDTNSFAGTLKGQLSGMLGAAALVGFGKGAIEAADKTDELSERLGITNKQAQEFSLAAKLGGSDAEFFATKFEKLRAALRDGALKGENPLAVFGLGATTDTVVAMEGLSKVITTVGLNAEQSAKFVDLMGKGAGKVINILGDLPQTKSGVLLFSDEEIQKLKEVDDKFTKIAASAKVLFAGLFSKNKNELADTALGRLFGIKAGEKKGRVSVDESGVLGEQAAKEESAKVHMAVQERLLKINKEIATVEEKNRIAGFTDDEMRVDLALRREEIFNRIARTEEERAQKELDLRLNEQAIMGVSKVSAKELSPLKDSLTSVGNFLGANPNSGQMKEFSEMNRKLDAIVRNTARTGGSIFPQ